MIFLPSGFKPYNAQFQFHAAVITHPDKDHYRGFEPIFASPQFGFDVVYHSGICERITSLGRLKKLVGLVMSCPMENAM